MKTAINLVNQSELAGFIKANGTACRFVSMVIRTPVVKIKAANPWGASKDNATVFKIQKLTGLLNADYVKAVEKRIAAALEKVTESGITPDQVQYTAKETWYKHLTTSDGTPLPLVVNKKTPDNGKLYLQYSPHSSSAPAYVTADNEDIPSDQVQPWLYAKGEKNEFKPPVISVELSNIVQMKASGVMVELPAAADALAALSLD